MKKVSKSIAALLCGALIAAAGSCSTGSGPMVVDGQEIKAGVYILKQQAAVNDALTKLREEQPDLDISNENLDVLKQTVEGKSFSEWVYEKTIEGCKEYVAVEKMFADTGLAVDTSTLSQMDSYISSIWSYSLGDKTYGETFEDLGVSIESYKAVQLNVQKEEGLFDYLYSVGGPNGVSEEELNSKLSEEYVGINYIPYKLTEGTSAQEYADMIKNGSTFEEVYQKYYTVELGADDTDAEKQADENGVVAADNYTIGVPETDSQILVLSRSSTSPSKELTDYAFDNMAVGDVSVVNVTDSTDAGVYIVQKVDLSTRPALTAAYADNVLHELKQTEFDEMLKKTYEGYSVNEGSTRIDYKLEKMITA